MSGACCVLTFHRVVINRERDHDLTWDSFLTVLDSIASPVTTDMMVGSVGPPSVVLTFDDGTSDHRAVGDALAQRGRSGVFFVPAGMVGSSGFMSKSHLRDLCAMGHVVGSHGLRNIRVDGLSLADLQREVRDSKELLEDAVGVAVRDFAAPGGSDHPQLASELEQTGYRFARSMRWGVHRSNVDRWRIPCIPVTELTISHGWVQRVLSDWKLPWPMRAAWQAKELLPVSLRSLLRGRIHEHL